MPAASLGSYINAAGTPRPVGAVALVKLNGEPLDGASALRVISSAPYPQPIDSASFTRPADTAVYAIGDLVANSVVGAEVVPLTFDVPEGITSIRAGSFLKSGAITTNANFRIHVYSSPPAPPNGDNGAWLTSLAGYLGSISVSGTSMINFSEGAWQSSSATLILPEGTEIVYALVEARAAYVPVSAEVFTIALEGY